MARTSGIRCLPTVELTRFLEPGEQEPFAAEEIDLRGTFCDVLQRAREFLPSEAGSIFLEEPVERDGNAPESLVLISCFGPRAGTLVGIKFPCDDGIIGRVYSSGSAYMSSHPESDPVFLRGPGGQMGHHVESVVCAPLYAGDRTVGVIELLNHDGPQGYTERDLELLQIFAQTISASIVNAMAAARARETAKRDDLTGLYNDRHLHHALTDVVAVALADDSDCGLLFLDLDKFKSVNDSHGHLVGSRVLSEVGQTLKRVLPGGSVAARYGGDEYVVALPNAGPQETMWAAESVRQSIEDEVFLARADPEDPVNYPALRIQGVITCSVGVATLRQLPLPTFSGVDPDTVKNELMHAADEAMYRAKDLGGNHTVPAWRPMDAAVPRR
jgi:diguanylate cyclase (GGDEF)-like protein